MDQMPTTSTPAKIAKSGPGNLPIITTPLWLTVARGFQFFFAIIIIGLTGYIIHYVYMDELGLTLAMSLFTWIIVAYVVTSEKISSLHGAYNIFAVLALDLFCIILWLSAMGAVAARRGTFTVPVDASCSSDGSAINSGTCVIWKRAIVMDQAGLGMLSGIAGLSALEMLLFVATFVYILLAYLKHRKANAPAAAAASSQGEIQMETKQPFLAQSQPYAPQTQPYSAETPPYSTQTQQYALQTQQYSAQTPQPQQQPYNPPQNYQEMPANQGQIYQGPPPTSHQTYEAPGNQQYQQYPPQQQQPYAPTPVSQVSPTNSPAPQGQMYQYPPPQ